MFNKNLLKKLSVFLLAIFILVGCGKADKSQDNAANKNETSQTETTKDAADMTFEEALESAKGKTVNFYGWGGDEKRNNWIDNSIAPKMKEKYDITVNRVPMDIDEINNLLLNENNAGKDGSIDVIWINGENFAAAKKQGFLFGPFTDKLPNFNDYVDGESADVKYDFGEPTEGLEAPYGKAQFVFVYDSAIIPNPPKNAEELLEVAKANPGKLTYAALPDFTGSVFVRQIMSDLQGYEQFMDKDLTQEKLAEMMKPTIDYLNELKPYLWKEGKTYPSDNPTLTNMFSDGEVAMAMSYNPNQASMMINDKKAPETTRSFVFDKGNIGNTHFLAISKMSPNKDAAMVFINEILAPENQIEKADPAVLGDLPVVSYEKLTDDQKKLYDSINIGEATIPYNELDAKKVPEMPAQLVPLIEKIWEENVLN